MGDSPSSWYYVSKAPVSARVPLCVWFSGLRGAIAPCIEEATTDRGLDEYEVRQYPGWHHHLLTTI
jgi:SRSO17 transposase